MNKSFAVRDLRFLIQQDPVAVVSSGFPVEGVKSRLDSKALAAAAGLQALYQFSVNTLASDWLTTENGLQVDRTPAKESVVAVDNVEYRLLGSMLDSLGVGLRLDLGAKYQ